MRLILIAITLFVYWLLLSGHYEPWLVVSGGVIAVAVVAFSLLKGITDEEGFPLEKLPRAAVYMPWLAVQIVRASLNVSRLILDPRLPISPSMVRVKAEQPTAVGLTAFANSITLTPGTISVEVSEQTRHIWVHAITREGAEAMPEDPMNEKAAWMDGVG